MLHFAQGGDGSYDADPAFNPNKQGKNHFARYIYFRISIFLAFSTGPLIIFVPPLLSEFFIPLLVAEVYKKITKNMIN